MQKAKNIFVSNRLPFSINKKTSALHRGSGGLVSALLGVSLDEPFSWVGFETDPKAAQQLRERSSEISPQLQSFPVLLSQKLYDQYYDGFSNDLIWPLFHYEGSLAKFNRADWDAYATANRVMADALAELVNPNDTVWIHDFHFLMLPQFLREKNITVKIGFFLHIPFPSYEIFRQLPVREEILKSLTQCDLIGFHEHSYLRHFSVSLKAMLGIDSSLFKADLGEHVLRMGVYPISIDTAGFKEKSSSPAVVEQCKAYHEMPGVPFLVLGIDRLDYTKGIELKLRGLQRALRKYPELVGKITLLQVAVPTRQKVPHYARLKKEVDQLVGSINGEFGRPGYVPVQYIFNSVQETELISLYRRANAILITSKRDGMNLVAMEFVIAQDLETPGVLILSEFAGAASLLSDAVMVNPWDMDMIADAILNSVHMPEDERRERLGNMQEILSRYSATKWAQSFLDDLSSFDPKSIKHVEKLKATCLDWPLSLRNAIEHTKKIRLILDYDGTLVAFADRPEKALLNQQMRELLTLLNQHVEIIIVSGRTKEFLDHQFKDLPFFLAAEHGAYFKNVGGEWASRIASDINAWYPEVESVMSSYTERVPLSFVEKKSASLVWHFRRSPVEFANYQSKKLDDELQVGLANEAVVISVGARIVEAKAIECNKGNFLRWLVHSEEQKNYYICIGDDKTDEDMFLALSDEGYSIKVGPGYTEAKSRLSEQAEVLPFLEELANSMRLFSEEKQFLKLSFDS